MPDNSNTQTPPAPENPAAAGPSAAELQAQLDEIKKQSEGRLRDLQNERAKRQELEMKLTPAPVAPVQPEVTQDELGKVLNPYIAPVVKELAETKRRLQQYDEREAMDYLVLKTGKSREALMSDTDFQEKLTNAAKRWGFVGSIQEVTRKAYEAMDLEKLRTQEAERARAATATGASSIPSGTPPPPAASKKSYSQEDFNNMSLTDYDKLSSNGAFHQDADGKIVYTPK